MSHTQHYSRATITFDVISNDDAENLAQRLRRMSIDAIARQMDTGDLVGGNMKVETVSLDKEQAEEELDNMGSDITFFGEDEEEDD